MKRSSPASANFGRCCSSNSRVWTAGPRGWPTRQMCGTCGHIAKRRTPTPAFDYVDGAAQRELTAGRTREAFDAVELLPRILHGTEKVDLSATIAGGTSSLPFGIAPTGFTRFMQAEGEDAGATAAAAAGIPFSLSTMGTRSIEQVAAATPAGRRWFQLYLGERPAEVARPAPPRGSFGLRHAARHRRHAGRRSAAEGCPQRHGDSAQADPQNRARCLLPARVVVQLPHHRPADVRVAVRDQPRPPTLINSMFDPSLSMADLEWIRSVWAGKLFVKGVLTAQDTRRRARRRSRRPHRLEPRRAAA